MSQSAQSPATNTCPQGLDKAEAVNLTTPPFPPPAHRRPQAPHRLRSSVSSRSLAWLADSKFCKNALASFQAAWPRPMKLLRAGYPGTERADHTQKSPGREAGHLQGPPLSGLLYLASPAAPGTGERDHPLHPPTLWVCTRTAKPGSHYLGQSPVTTWPGVQLRGAAFLPRKHTLHLQGTSPHGPLHWPHEVSQPWRCDKRSSVHSEGSNTCSRVTWRIAAYFRGDPNQVTRIRFLCQRVVVRMG